MAPPVRSNGLDAVRQERVRDDAPVDAGTIEVGVGQPDKAGLAELKKTNPSLASTVDKAQKAYGDLLAKGARIVVTTPAGNGGAPVVTLVPPGFDPTKPAKVQTHYHGDRTSAAEPNGIASKAIHELVAKDPQTVFVLPEAKGNVGESGTDWSNAKDQASTTADSLAAAGVTDVSERTVSAHSAGGRALATALKDGKVQADRVVLLDCLYQPAKDQIKAGLQKYGGDVKEIVVTLGTNEPERARDMVKTFEPRSRLVRVPSTGDTNPHDGSVRWMLNGRTNLAPDQSRFKDTFG